MSVFPFPPTGRLIRNLGPGLAGLALLAPFFMLLGHSPWEGYASLWRGSLGGIEALTNTSLKAGPLLLLGAGVLLALRGGFLNIGGEGQFLLGALGAAAWARYAPPGAELLGWAGPVLAGMAAGAIWCALAAYLRVKAGVEDVIGTLMLNFVALYLVSYAVHGPLQESAGAYPQTDSLPEAFSLPRWEGGRIHLGLALSAAAVALASLWSTQTVSGFLSRAVGQNPRVAEASGISVGTYTLATGMVSGGLCGLAGALELGGVTGRVFESYSSGYGYTAIAVALLARLHLAWLWPSALFFAGLSAGAAWTQRALGIPPVILLLVQGLVIAAAAVGSRLSTSRDREGDR